MVEIKITRGKVALVDDVDADLAAIRWQARPVRNRWYAASATLGYLHRVVARRAGLAIDDTGVDHENGDGLDCRRHNLRPADQSQNNCNKGPQSNCKSGRKGVSWDPVNRKWRADIRIKGRRFNLGRFADIESAASAYAAAAERLHGEFARTI